MLPPKVEVRVKKINLRRKIAQNLNDFVATEVPVEVHVNRQHVTTLFSSPQQLRELSVGWLLSHAIISSLNEISSIYVKKNRVKIRCVSEVDARIKAAKIPKMVDSSCGSTADDFVFLIDRIAKPLVNSSYRVKAEEILEFIRVLNQNSKLFRLTGGTHSAAIFHQRKLVAFAEDVGRHNAVDKVIGAVALKKVNFSECVLVSSGRQPADMVLKAARVGIPIIASIAGPVYSGVEAALKTGVTLICFVRGQRMNVYSYPERVEFTRIT